MDSDQQRRIVEAIVLASPEPISAQRIAALIPHCKLPQVRTLVKELNEEYVEQRRAFEIWEVAGGYQMRSLPEFAPYLKQIQKERPLRLSQAALETLAIVAYRQPVTRAEIEHIRGVDAGAVVRGLLERDLVRIAGHREVAGRPIVYATSRRFLEVFGLARLGDLPSLRDVEALEADADEGNAAVDEGDGAPDGDATSEVTEVEADAAIESAARAEADAAVEAEALPEVDAAPADPAANPTSGSDEAPKETAALRVAAAPPPPPGPTS